MKKFILLLVTHLIFAAIGFAGGIYALPILMAPDSPTTEQLANASGNVVFSGSFRRDIPGSDFMHWGEGELLIGNDYITFAGELAPGPDYKLYLSPVVIQSAAQFEQYKASMALIGDVRTFKNFIVAVPEEIDPEAFRYAVVWCETFGAFVTATGYR